MTFPGRFDCAAAFCTATVLRKNAKWSRHCPRHRLKLKCRAPDCGRPLRNDNTGGFCKRHRPVEKHPCGVEGCGRLISPAAQHCVVHASRLRGVRRRKAPPPPQPTKTSRKQLDRQRLWKKLHPKGPPCSIPGCTNRLAQASQGKGEPVCMDCRIATGALQRNLKPASERRIRRGAQGMFATHTASTPPGSSPDTGSGS